MQKPRAGTRNCLQGRCYCSISRSFLCPSMLLLLPVNFAIPGSVHSNVYDGSSFCEQLALPILPQCMFFIAFQMSVFGRLHICIKLPCKSRYCSWLLGTVGSHAKGGHPLPVIPLFTFFWGAMEGPHCRDPSPEECSSSTGTINQWLELDHSLLLAAFLITIHWIASRCSVSVVRYWSASLQKTKQAQS